jgi:hypothetical protein
MIGPSKKSTLLAPAALRVCEAEGGEEPTCIYRFGIIYYRVSYGVLYYS